MGKARMASRWRHVALLFAALLAQGCSRQETGTAVLSGRQPAPAASSPAPAREPAVAVPAAPSSTPASSVAPAASPALTQASQPAASPLADGRGSDGPALLALRPLIVPVEGVAPSALVDNYDQPRGEGRHEAIDILAPRGTRVFAVDDGKLVKLFTSKPGGLTVYQFDPDGNLAYYYAHLDRYAQGLTEGMMLHRGDLVGYVGASGNAAPEAPHLHFAVFRLGPQRQWWKGDPINPYTALRNAQPAR